MPIINYCSVHKHAIIPAGRDVDSEAPRTYKTQTVCGEPVHNSSFRIRSVLLSGSKAYRITTVSSTYYGWRQRVMARVDHLQASSFDKVGMQVYGLCAACAIKQDLYVNSAKAKIWKQTSAGTQPLQPEPKASLSKNRHKRLGCCEVLPLLEEYASQTQI